MAKSKSKKPRAKRPAGAPRGEWDAFERAILRSAGNGRQISATRNATTIEPSEAEVLRRLAERSRVVRGRSAPLGNVVFLHGVTGSDLSVSPGFGKLDSVWVSIVNLARGHIEKLCLAEDGMHERDRTLQVRPTGVNKRFYGRAVLALRAHWNVEPFAYDWRKDINEASDNLAAFIRQRFPDEPVHLVAHSMGGLVARNFISRHRDLWASMKDPTLERGGRLVMLGTPNYGSYAIVQVLSGTDAMLTRLQRFDLEHDMKELLAITNSFPGTYLLLPAFAKLSPEAQRLYEGSSWGANLPVSQRHLDRAFQFYGTLDTPANTDPERLLYVAGVNQSTIAGVKILSPGQFDYEFTLQGDGRVPLELGRLPGVPTSYIDELHGDLAKNERVLLALDEMLQKGTTKQLDSTPEAAIASRGAMAATRSARAYRSADRAALELLSEMASRTRRADTAEVLSEEEQQLAADAILNSAVGARSEAVPQRKDLTSRRGKAASATKSVGKSVRIRVGARFGTIENFSAQLVVVGHYRGVRPVKAIGAIDRKLDGWLRRAIRRGMISGQTGETFFVPTKGRLAASGVIVAGMGDYGSFKTADLKRIMANVALGAAALGTRTLGAVLMGAGEGGLPLEAALRQIIDGFGAGIAELYGELEDEGASRAPRAAPTLWIVEVNPQRFAQLRTALDALAATELTSGVRLLVATAPAAELAAARKAAVAHAKKSFDRAAVDPNENAEKFDEVRLTIECEPDQGDGARRFTISALSETALVPVQRIEVSARVIEDLGRGLSEAESPERQQQFGRLLFRYLMPREFETLFESDAAVRLIVDPASAAFPWEMACLPSKLDNGEYERFGVERRLTRQFRSLLFGSTGQIPARNRKLRALVIADPAPEPEWQLPGARAEGARVASLLRFANGRELDFGIGGRVKLDIEVDEFIGHQQCEPLEVIARLTSGDYDHVHFAGHGIYDKEDQNRSGWVLSNEHFVTPRDIARSRQTPWFIFANACFSGVVNAAAEIQPLEEARRAASIAEIFMQAGVRNYLGTGWAVDDQQATAFASKFYAALLFANWPMADALRYARELLLGDRAGATWGAYQLYGSPSDRVLPRRSKLDESTIRSCSADFERKGG